MHLLDHPYDNYDNNKDLAATALADFLINGSLALFIGAGASKNRGLPLWWELVKKCANDANIKGNKIDKNTNTETLRQIMEKVKDSINNDEDYLEIVKKNLYSRFDDKMNVISEKLLIAIGALLMKSKRGNISEIITLNFDDILEWYLGLHGFSTNVVIDLPYLKNDSDVTIFHRHGFIPYKSNKIKKSNTIVFDEYSYDENYSEDNEWNRLIFQILNTKIVIFLGLSGNDPIFRKILIPSKKNLEKFRPTGFWLSKKREKNLKDNDYFKKRNIVLLTFSKYDDIHLFLLKICQIASDKIDRL